MSQFYLEKKVYYHDTDCGGVMYYANYLKHLEEGRTEFCLSRGVDMRGLSEKGVLFVVARVEVNYKSPARYLDTVRVITRVEEICRSSVHFIQEIRREDKLLVEAKITWVCVNRNFKPQSVPEIIKSLKD